MVYNILIMEQCTIKVIVVVVVQTVVFTGYYLYTSTKIIHKAPSSKKIVHGFPKHLRYCNVQKHSNYKDGILHVELNESIATKFPESVAKTINKGGWWRPLDCKAQKEVAIIIPKRGRDVQLQMFLYHMHPFLQKKKLAYRMIVVEQLGEDEFNKGSLLNIAYLHARNYSNFDCFVFHDIDYLPINIDNDYTCAQSPMARARCIHGSKTFNSKNPRFWGGVWYADKTSFELVNGCPNLYFGWGGEDDEFGIRFRNTFKHLANPDCRYDQYLLNKHKHTRSKKRMDDRIKHCLICSAVQRMHTDGLNSLKYHLKEVIEESLYTIIRVEIKQSDYQSEYPFCPKEGVGCKW